MQDFAASLAEEHRDGHAPNALPRDAPVWTRRDHVADALFAPRRVPLNFFDLIKRALPQRAATDRAFHRDKPLFGCTKDDRLVTPPAMRIRMLQLRLGKQGAARFQQLN